MIILDGCLSDVSRKHDSRSNQAPVVRVLVDYVAQCQLRRSERMIIFDGHLSDASCVHDSGSNQAIGRYVAPELGSD
jgi:hypothetical protein